ncbi:MAG: glycosyltransferase family 29 protein [Phenylobacterium sp.]
MSNIIAIGNGPSVIGKGQGGIIDNFDVVLRINNFVIDGFEKDIGTKTSIWARSDSPKVQKLDFSLFDQVLFCLPPNNYKNEIRMTRVKSLLTPNCQIISKVFVFALQKEMALPKKKWPSTGAIAIKWLLSKYKKISIIGFDCFAASKNPPRHYYDSPNSSMKIIGHHTVLEKAFINKYVRSKRIEVL